MSKVYYWYGDDELRIVLNKLPARPEIRYPEPTDTIEEKKDKKKYPIYVRKSFKTVVSYLGVTYIIAVEKGTCTDGSTIHRIFWSLLGENNYSPNLIIGSIIHDMLCINPAIINHNRTLGTKIYRDMAIASGTPTWKANLMAFFINCWQFLVGDWDSSLKGWWEKFISFLLH